MSVGISCAYPEVSTVFLKSGFLYAVYHVPGLAVLLKWSLFCETCCAPASVLVLHTRTHMYKYQVTRSPSPLSALVLTGSHPSTSRSVRRCASCPTLLTAWMRRVKVCACGLMCSPSLLPPPIDSLKPDVSNDTQHCSPPLFLCACFSILVPLPPPLRHW